MAPAVAECQGCRLLPLCEPPARALLEPARSTLRELAPRVLAAPRPLPLDTRPRRPRAGAPALPLDARARVPRRGLRGRMGAPRRLPPRHRGPPRLLGQRPRHLRRRPRPRRVVAARERRPPRGGLGSRPRDACARGRWASPCSRRRPWCFPAFSGLLAAAARLVRCVARRGGVRGPPRRASRAPAGHGLVPGFRPGFRPGSAPRGGADGAPLRLPPAAPRVPLSLRGCSRSDGARARRFALGGFVLRRHATDELPCGGSSR